MSKLINCLQTHLVVKQCIMISECDLVCDVFVCLTHNISILKIFLMIIC